MIMNRVRSLLEKRHATGSRVSILSDSSMSSSGQAVNTESALTLSPLWQGLFLLSGDLGKLPFVTFQVGPDRGEGLPRGNFHHVTHPCYSILRGHTGEMTSNVWVRLMVNQAALYGNSYSLIHRQTVSGKRFVKSLEWVHENQVVPKRSGGKSFYQVRWNQDWNGREGVESIPPHNMFHLPGLMIDPLGGLSLIKYARNTIGRQLSTERFHDDFYVNGLTPQGFFIHPDVMSDGAKERFAATVRRKHLGPGRAHGFGVLEEDVRWQATGITPKDALLIDALNMGVVDVSRFLSMPIHKLNVREGATYNNIEQENQSYLESTLRFWIDGFECEASHKLLNSEDRHQRQVFCQFDLYFMVRASMESRYKSYAVALRNQVMTPNEVRELENLPPLPGGDDVLPLPNAADVGVNNEDRPNQLDSPSPEADDLTENDRSALRGVVADSMQFAANRMNARLGRAATRKAGRRDQWQVFTETELESHREVIRENFEQPVRMHCVIEGRDFSLLDQVVDSYLDRWRTGLRQAGDCDDSLLRDHVKQFVKRSNEIFQGSAVLCPT